jgi:hypothetical protein
VSEGRAAEVVFGFVVRDEVVRDCVGRDDVVRDGTL